MTAPALANPRLFSFAGGNAGLWMVESVQAVTGESLPSVSRIEVVAGTVAELPSSSSWLLRGITSNERYVTHSEKTLLVDRQEGLGRVESTRAALIPIRKSAAWWALAQDERRRIFEEQSQHVVLGLKYLPAVARRLHHCRDLGPNEPFDFLTWFEYVPVDSERFEEIVRVLRASPEWEFVDREVDIRLTYAGHHDRR